MRPETIRRLPKVLLHEHLDGGLRPGTIIEIADRIGHRLPAGGEESLSEWFTESARRGGLPGYLETFVHTLAVMQTADDIERVAFEAGEDLAADGVVHAEIRFAPELNTNAGLTMDDVLEAAIAGLDRSRTEYGIGFGVIVDGMRQGPNTLRAAQAAARWADRGVVGFDIAGPEAGFPAGVHAEAFGVAARAGLGITIHAGESFGPASIAEALDCGAERLGHGVRIVDDIGPAGELGPVASRVLDAGIPLEVCPTSNLHIGLADELADHPVDRLLRLGFVVTINCDNRLMSDTSATAEMSALVQTFGWGVDELRDVTVAAARSLFGVDGDRPRIRRWLSPRSWTGVGASPRSRNRG